MGVPRYTIEGDEVFYTHHYCGKQRLDGAQAASFKPLVDPVVEETDRRDWHFAGKDHASVWFMQQRVEEADAASFRYFYGGQCKWGADGTHVFSFYEGKNPRVKVAKSNVSSSLRFLDEPYGAYMRKYALTDERVYYFGRWVRGADPKTFRNMTKECVGEQNAPSEIYRDDRFSYHFGRKLAGIDPDALILFQYPQLGSRVYGVDRENAYYVDGSTRTPGRDVSGTPTTRLTLEEVRTDPRYEQARTYLATRTDLTDYWFNRE